MAQYEHLPIYKKAYDLTVYFEKIVHNFSRYHKYQIGAELRQQSREVLRQIIRANNAADRAPHLEKLRELLEDLKITVRVAKDLKVFANFDSFQYSVNQVVDLCRQNEGWLKSTLQKSGRPESSSHAGAGQERAN
jgi:23S rRNA-intervening sequence protein